MVRRFIDANVSHKCIFHLEETLICIIQLLRIGISYIFDYGLACRMCIYASAS